jgi:acyl-CoA reductase-like NAD-dependent aldehyde dehydrogenase
VPETTALLEQDWDFIFFTGSPRVGKIVDQAAAKHLTATVLELGGKNPTIVHSSANIEVAARRIANMRFSNAGQICTGPDHVLVWPEVKDRESIPRSATRRTQTTASPWTWRDGCYTEDSSVARVLSATGRSAVTPGPFGRPKAFISNGRG